MSPCKRASDGPTPPAAAACRKAAHPRLLMHLRSAQAVLRCSPPPTMASQPSQLELERQVGPAAAPACPHQALPVPYQAACPSPRRWPSHLPDVNPRLMTVHPCTEAHC